MISRILQLLFLAFLGWHSAGAAVVQPTDSATLARQRMNAETDSAFAAALKALPDFDTLPRDIQQMRDPVANIKGRKVKFSQLMKSVMPVRPTGTWTDSIRHLQRVLATSAPFFMDTLLQCLSYCRRTALKGFGEISTSEVVQGWSYERWHQAFITDKNMAGNCGIYTQYMYTILREAAGVQQQVIYSAGNEEGGHTFLIVRHHRTWYIVDPTYAGLWMMNNEPASVPVLLDSLRADSLAPLKRFTTVTFNDQLYPATIGVLMTKMELWSMWKYVKQPVTVYETNAYTTVPFHQQNMFLYFLAGIPYTGSQKLYEVRTQGNRMVPDGEGSKAYVDKDGYWQLQGMKSIFDAANLPTHFSSLLLLTKTPSLTGNQALVNQLREFFLK